MSILFDTGKKKEPSNEATREVEKEKTDIIFPCALRSGAFRYALSLAWLPSRLNSNKGLKWVAS